MPKLLDFKIKNERYDHITTESETDDKQWNKYFADKPAIDLPTDTNTEQFVNSARGRVIKQVKPWL